MRDGPARRAVKRLALGTFTVNLFLLRRLQEAPYTLAGDCRRCARCCEAPAIRVGFLTWYLPTLRRIFLWWHRVVNGFEQTDVDRRGRAFIFRCSHFDWKTRSCDSYGSRPGMCRDYPRALLHQPAPELLAGCGYRAVARNRDRWLRLVEERPLSPEQKERLKRGLHLV